MDYATRYPEAVPLCAVSAKIIAKELFMVFSWVGINKEILTDQGTLFMSRIAVANLSVLSSNGWLGGTFQ